MMYGLPDMENNLALPLFTIPACPIYLNLSLSTLQSITGYEPWPYNSLNTFICLKQLPLYQQIIIITSCPYHVRKWH